MSTRKTERANALADALARRGVLHLRDAAALLGVSEMTVRRDVSAMPDRFAYLGGHIRYDLGDAEKAGLERFVELLVRHGGRQVFRPRFVA